MSLSLPDSTVPIRTRATSGGRLVSTEGRALALEGSRLIGSARGGIAHVELEQRFRNVHPEPLRAVYELPLPADAVVTGYSFRIGEREVTGTVERREEAREHYEEALLEGRTAGLLEQDRSGFFRQEIGNIPPFSSVVARLVLDQRLRWLEEGSWEWRFPTVVAPRYLGSLKPGEDVARLTIDVADPDDPALNVHATLGFSIEDELHENGVPSSPSHEIQIESRADGAPHALRDVTFAASGVVLDRDVVLRWPVAGTEPGITLTAGRDPRRSDREIETYGLLTIVPPLPAAAVESFSRDLIVLVDTSGSMQGAPIDQAKRVVCALIESLGARDRLELIEFSDAPHRWKPGAVQATPESQREALAWVAKLSAGGATGMGAGIVAALGTLRQDAQRQVVLVTDGLIGAEAQVVGQILRGLPLQTRVHAVGIGSAVNRTLTASVARAGRGAEVIVAPSEDPAAGVERLLARTCRPLVTALTISGDAVRSHAPALLPDLFAGAPTVLALSLRPGGGELRVHGKTAGGDFAHRVLVPAAHELAERTDLASLYARERVEDLEIRAAAQAVPEIDAEIERIGLAYQIETRRTSWVAIAEEPGVDPTKPIRRERIPHALPQGMSAEGMGLMRVGVPNALLQMMSMRAESAWQAPAGEEMVGSTDYAVRMRRSFARKAGGSILDVLVGELVSYDERHLGIEVEFEHGLEFAWTLRTRVQVKFDDGRELEFRIDPTRTTAPGAVPAGARLRLVLVRSEPWGEARPVGVYGKLVRVGRRALQQLWIRIGA